MSSKFDSSSTDSKTTARDGSSRPSRMANASARRISRGPPTRFSPIQSAPFCRANRASSLRVQPQILMMVLWDTSHSRKTPYCFVAAQTMGCVGWHGSRRAGICPCTSDRRHGQANACPCHPSNNVRRSPSISPTSVPSRFQSGSGSGPLAAAGPMLATHYSHIDAFRPIKQTMHDSKDYDTLLR